MIRDIILILLLLTSLLLVTFCEPPPIPHSNWTEIIIEGEKPSPRYCITITYIENSNKIILFGGGAGDGDFDAQTDEILLTHTSSSIIPIFIRT